MCGLAGESDLIVRFCTVNLQACACAPSVIPFLSFPTMTHPIAQITHPILQLQANPSDGEPILIEDAHLVFVGAPAVLDRSTPRAVARHLHARAVHSPVIHTDHDKLYALWRAIRSL